MQIRVSYDINVNSAHVMSGGNRLTDSYVNIHPPQSKEEREPLTFWRDLESMLAESSRVKHPR